MTLKKHYQLLFYRGAVAAILHPPTQQNNSHLRGDLLSPGKRNFRSYKLPKTGRDRIQCHPINESSDMNKPNAATAQPEPSTDLPDALKQFKQFYTNFDWQALEALDQVYAEDVVFTDPVHMIQGREALQRYFKSLCGNLSECRFEFVAETVKPGHACFKWKMFYRHPKIKRNAPLHITGVSLIGYTEKIHSHEDFYDMGAMIYEHVPVLGMVIRKVKTALAKKAIPANPDGTNSYPTNSHPTNSHPTNKEKTP